MSYFRGPDNNYDYNVDIASTANLGLSTLGAIDGITPTTGMRVLAKDQTTGSQNGVYVAVSGSWNRAPEFGYNVAGLINQDVLPGHTVKVNQGTANANSEWICTNTGGITLGTTALTYKRIDGQWDEWETLWAGSCSLPSASVGATYLIRQDGGTGVSSGTAASMTAGTLAFPLDPAQYAVTGKTVQIRVVGMTQNNTAAQTGITFTFGLYQISSIAGFTPTLAAVTTGSTAAISAPAANAQSSAYSSTISMPAAGLFCLGMVNSGVAAIATPSIVLRGSLQMRVTS